ncbi:RagB/SusD family nutrient uptake outer membrane protein [Pinibacter aurantiacus]|uniref:RagB/SusD family nutrient uptake outer membrane protein n=1 Tax=Pinibacter aurantiacus TaxID=2851599 RepID=A0A9E2W2K8_9BACT|nr:RagB/SusD family nutrient uptake outer membrane protein [Pinibacter aurantiacus]MBV4355909.1 RagB/SusD family nutrient uptake outer membrane protein [Pinibacter aurantiacus]
MKRILFYILPLYLLTACNKLDIPPTNIIQDKDVFSSPSGIESYMATLYSALPIQDFNSNYQTGFNDFPCFHSYGLFTAECLQSDYVGARGIGNGSFGYWPYVNIRNVNYFIETFPKYAGSFTEDKAKAWLGEAHFIRAFFYFALVERYGGVPIVRTPQSYPEQSLDELQIPRNKEEEVYNFIGADLDTAINYMPDIAESKSGRANKYVAAALKSRAMLFAGSIAKYGTVQLDGVVGIPADKATSYFQQSFDAAKMLEGKYSLYRANPDKYQNYVNLFLDGNSPENILVKQYHYPEKTHSWDALNIPRQLQGGNGYSSVIDPTLDYVELYGSLQVYNPDGTPIRFSDRMDLFKNVEPRLRATVTLPGDVFRGAVMDMQRGLYESYSGKPNSPEAPEHDDPNDSKLHLASDPTVQYSGKNVVGFAGPGRSESTSTGFYIRKYMDPTKPNSEILLWQSYQNWIAIRYAEVLLNKAEAAYELGKPADALTAINDIRDRAGASALGNLNMDSIRNERKKELAFENFTWWDLRRWRVADKEFNNRIYRVLYPYYVFDEKKYIYRKEPDIQNARFTFQQAFYYEPIPAGEINKNPKLIQNPLY